MLCRWHGHLGADRISLRPRCCLPSLSIFHRVPLSRRPSALGTAAPDELFSPQCWINTETESLDSCYAISNLFAHARFPFMTRNSTADESHRRDERDPIANNHEKRNFNEEKMNTVRVSLIWALIELEWISRVYCRTWTFSWSFENRRFLRVYNE